MVCLNVFLCRHPSEVFHSVVHFVAVDVVDLVLYKKTVIGQGDEGIGYKAVDEGMLYFLIHLNTNLYIWFPAFGFNWCFSKMKCK